LGKGVEGLTFKGASKSKRRSALLQKGFFDRILRSHESYSEKWNYVRNNPVRANLAENADRWPFSGKVVDLEFRND
jgi:hypothetical protein